MKKYASVTPRTPQRKRKWRPKTSRTSSLSAARLKNYWDSIMATDLSLAPDETGIGEINKYDFVTPSHAVFKAERGLNPNIVSAISEMKQEPAWMRDFRLKSLKTFE